MNESRLGQSSMRLIPRKAALVLCVLVCPLAAWAASGQSAATAPAQAVEQDTGADASQQGRREWVFEKDGIRFDNELSGARLSAVQRVREGVYRVRINPETYPINPSPWYGFRIRSDAPRAVEIQFSYPQDLKHRYIPKISRDGRRWQPVDAQSFGFDGKGNASLKLQLEAGELRVFAQPPFSPEDFAAWSAQVAAKVGTQPQAYGSSVQGRALQLFEFGAGAEAPVLLVLGRQHPPEFTGTRALVAFVEALVADTPQARAFRERVQVVVAPLLNPDGLANGNWRGNANGVDINRDWGPFAQPETRALRDALAARGIGPGRVAFMIDFHTNTYDVFYTVAEDPSRAKGGVMQQWLAAMHSKYKIRESASAASNATSQNWAVCRLGAPSVTYEVRDEKPLAVIDETARHAAAVLMELLSEPREVAPPPVCAKYTFAVG